jgi:hypothetical protein
MTSVLKLLLCILSIYQVTTNTPISCGNYDISDNGVCVYVYIVSSFYLIYIHKLAYLANNIITNNTECITFAAAINITFDCYNHFIKWNTV